MDWDAEAQIWRVGRARGSNEFLFGLTELEGSWMGGERARKISKLELQIRKTSAFR